MINPFSILNRYLLLEMMPPFFINLAFFSFIFLMKQILDITDMIVNHKVGLGPVVLLLVYSLPYFLRYVIPMSVMMAVLLAMLRLSGDSEIMALKAGGVSIYRLVTPVMMFSLMGTLITGLMTLYGLPFGADRFRSLLFDVAVANVSIGLKERTFNDNFESVMLYVNRIDPQTRELHNIFIEDHRQEGVGNAVVARSGRLVGDPEALVYYLRLFDGTISQVDMPHRTGHTVDFESYDIRLDFKENARKGDLEQKRADEMPLADHRAHLQAPHPSDRHYRNALMHYHRRFSIPLACLSMGLLALPLGVQSRHSKKAFGIGLGLFFFLLYYILLSLGSTLGEKGAYPPLLAMWVPNLVLGGFGVYLLVRAARERPMTIRWLDRLLDSTIKMVGKS